ncbi:MAG: hypothetical protein H5T41_01770 [Methanomassiliicoccales archaeon]|jgi:DNA-directed RNA polymerase subunit RPC12/RpoP|nr:hypothetical protein [Methanomassiliicoccales archaeon]
MDITISLNCPACGGAISIGEGGNVVICEYCGSTLFVEGDSGVYTIAFKNKITKDGALVESKRWWSEGFKARDLKKLGKIVECYAIYLPFWNIDLKIAGWICGYEEHIHTDSKGNVHRERIPREIMILKEYAFTEIACDPGDLGIRNMKNLSGETSFEDFEMIPTFESTTSKDDALQHAKEDAFSRARDSTRLTEITFERLHVLPKRIFLVYYPIWVVRYEYRDRMYVCTIDGVTGRIISGRAPGDPIFQSLAATAGASIGGLIAAAGILISQADPGIALAAIGAGLAILYAFYRFFRRGSEIIVGDFSERSYSPGEVMKEISEVTRKFQRVYR